MATIRWVGGAAAVAQVNTFAFAGTWEVGDLIRVTVGQKSWDYAVTSTTVTTFLPLFVTAFAALDAADYPEFAEITPTSNSSTLTLTAATAGVPFVCTLTPLESDGSPADAQTIEGAGTATTGTAATASAGPNDWSTAANWSGGSVPTTGDSVYLEDSEDDIKYGLAQSSVTLTLLEVRGTFTGTLGLPAVNQDGTAYPEYRGRYLAISATTLNVGAGVGSGSGRLLLNTGSNACALTVYGTASGLDTDAAALQWKGAHASNTATVYRGEVDVARLAGDAATIATLRVGYETSQDSDASVRCGSGTTLTTITQNGGSLTVASAFTTANKYAGTLEVLGAGAVTTINNYAGLVTYSSSGTLTTYVGAPGSSLDLSKDMRAKTITNCTLYAGASLDDSGAAVTYTNPILLSRCRVGDVSVDFGYNRSIAVS